MVAVGFDVVYGSVADSPHMFMVDLEGMAKGIRSLREPLELAIRNVMAPSISTNFTVGGRPAWNHLEQTTIDKKEMIGAAFPEDILVETGRLAEVAGQLGIWDINGGYGNLDEASAEVTDLKDAEYGNFHQTGFHVGKKYVAPRQFLVIQPQDEVAIQEIFDVWIARRAFVAGWK